MPLMAQSRCEGMSCIPGAAERGRVARQRRNRYDTIASHALNPPKREDQIVENSAGMSAGTGAQQVVQRMGEAATNFLASLAADQKAKAVFDFGQEEMRTFWHYTPIPREGLPFSEMDRTQQQLAQRLVATGLSRSGYVTACAIMGLETILDAVEGWSHPLPGRDSRLYYLQIFGRPSSRDPWGWSFEGHHISLNYTIVGDHIVAPTPTFFGANPAETPLGETSTLRPLQGIEDLAREFVHALDEEQRAAAVIASVAPPDIVLTNRPYVTEGALLADEMALNQWRAAADVSDGEVEALRSSRMPQGISSASLSNAQQEVLTALIGDYIRRMPEELAEIERMKFEQDGSGAVHFAWAGGLERGQPHYYRIQSNLFLAEYDNTQNDANHIHSVWRDPRNDFGADILARHYAHSH